MVNRGYQAEDLKAFDYQLWRLPRSQHDLRGPRIDVSAGSYFSAIGAAQTFGRFSPITYCDLLARDLKISSLNLGFSGAGPTYFSSSPELLDYINRSRFVIVQVMSGRSVGNSYFDTAQNQGLVKPRGSDTRVPAVFAEHAYRELLTNLDPAEAIRLRTEIRLTYVAEMLHLLACIKVPKMLLYWSTRVPNYKEGIGGIGSYWGAFPHFINASVLAEIRPAVDSYVEVITDRGLPQPVYDECGQPLTLWPEDKFPDVKLRSHNLYYPSPEMHVDVAAALTNRLPVTCKVKVRPTPRDLLVHVHVFKNAGSSIDASLQRHFGNHWINIDPESSSECFGNEDLLKAATKLPSLRALSSHQLRFPITGSSEVNLLPFVLLRHPIDRVQSIYHWERLEVRQRQSKGLHTRQAAALSFPDFVEWSLTLPGTRGPIANYQTRMCSLTANGMRATDWMVDPTLTNLREALANLTDLPVIGIVEEFSKTVDLLNIVFGSKFPGLQFVDVRRNVTQASAKPPLFERLRQIKNSLGDQVFNKLLYWNELDLELYSLARRRIGLDS